MPNIVSKYVFKLNAHELMLIYNKHKIVENAKLDSK